MRRALLLLSILPLVGCSSVFGYRLELRGGWDDPTGDDQVYLHATSIAGLEDGINALVVPADWRDRPSVAVGPGVRALDPPLALEWIRGRDALPAAREIHVQGWANPNRWQGDPALLVQIADENPGAPYPDLPAHSCEAIHERLARGQSAVVLVPSHTTIKRGFVVFVADGPPLAWTRLGAVEVAPEEGPLEWTVTRSLGALAYGLDLAAIPVYYGAGVLMAPVGGLAVFSEPAPIPETPW